MELTVKLYGTLSHSFDGYDHSKGLAVDIPKGSTIHDLLNHLNILPKRVGIILMDGKPMSANNLLVNHTEIRIFQPISGG